MKYLKIVKISIYLMFIMVSFLLSLFSFDNYSIFSNTTSHLGAQGSPYAWVMNFTFISLGLVSFVMMISSRIIYHKVVGSVFAISLVFTGIFQHESLLANFQSIIWLDQLHSVFATTTGISFVLLSAGHGFMSKGKQRMYGFALALIATLLSLFMTLIPSYMGLFQRVMFMVSFGWLFFYMNNPIERQMKTVQPEKSRYN